MLLHEDDLAKLSREQLINIISAYQYAYCLIGETLVEVSKVHITEERALADIRKYLRKRDLITDKIVNKERQL